MASKSGTSGLHGPRVGKEEAPGGSCLKVADITLPHHRLNSSGEYSPSPGGGSAQRCVLYRSAIKSMESVITFREGPLTCARHYAECRATETSVSSLKFRCVSTYKLVQRYSPAGAAERHHAQPGRGAGSLEQESSPHQLWKTVFADIYTLVFLRNVTDVKDGLHTIYKQCLKYTIQAHLRDIKSLVLDAKIKHIWH